MIEIIQFDKYFQQIDNETFEARFTLCHEIGRGAGSTVQKAKDNNRQDSYVAIKLYNKQQLKQYTRIDVVREIQILNYIKRENFSQHFVNLIDAFKIVYKNSYKTQYCLVMDLCDLSLEQLAKNKQELLLLPEKERIKICLKIAKGVECLHSINLLHRDLKPDNILLKKTSESYEPVISDFGHSKENRVFMTSLRGTPLYVDPALQNTQNYGFQWDIYSLGLIFIKVMSGQFIIRLPEPLPSKGEFHLMLIPALKNIAETLRAFKFNERVKEIIENCLISKRWEIKKIVLSFQAILNSMLESSKISQQLTFQSVEQSRKQKSKTMIVKTESITKSLQVKQGSEIMKKKVQSFQSQKKQSNPENLLMPKKVISSQLEQKNSLTSKIKAKSVFSEKYQSRIKSPIKKQSQIKIKSEQSIKFEQIKQRSELKNEKKISRFEKNKTELVGKMFRLRNTLSINLDGFNSQVQKLEVIKKYEGKLQKIQIIERSSISKQTKNQLIALSFIYLKMVLKQHLKEIQNDEFLQKHLNSFHDKVDTLFQPLLEYMKKNQFKMNKNARSLLWGQTNVDSNQVKKQFYQIVKSECPLQRSILQRSIL